MIKYTFILFLISSLMVGAGCNSFDAVETDTELVEYFEIFAKEGAKRGFTVDYEAERIEGLLQDIINPNIQGQCFRNEEKPKKVIIDVDYWNNANELEKQFIIYHELGHCFLGRDHLDGSDASGTCISIMHSNPGACNFLLTEDNKKEYLDELFSE